jgi:hypothetical protein
MINTWSIDSLRVRIPMKECTIVDNDLNAIFHTINSHTGEILETKLNSKSNRTETGISTHFHLTKEYNNSNVLESHIVILLNAKALKEQYFTGINDKTLNNLYQYIQGLNVVSFSFKAFKQAQCTDIDIKKDIQCDKQTMLKAFKVIKENAKAHKEKNIGLNKGSNDKMLSFNDRKNTNFLKAPFLKIYDKTTELKENSIDFMLSNLKQVPNDLWRIEYTIKNKKHLNKLNIPNTLGEIAKVKQDCFEAGYQTTLRACLNKRIREIRETSTAIQPKDIILTNSVILLFDTGKYTWSTLKSTLLGSLTGSNRCKKDKQLQYIYESYIKPIERYSNYEKLDTILNQIGYTF